MKTRTIGMLGGGQLGRMSALAAAPLGIRTHVFCPEVDAPAVQVTSRHTRADYDDQKALAAFADQVDVITYEFENIPVETVRFLEKRKPVYPSSAVLEIAQDRLKEKAALNKFKLPTTRWAPAKSAKDVQAVMKKWKTTSCILKTIRFGYDGKGQVMVKKAADAAKAFAQLKADVVIVEEVVDFLCEISVIVARDTNGAVGSYTPGQNEHKHHILHKTAVPAECAKKLLREAQTLAHNLAVKIKLVGVLGVEMFLTKDKRWLVNEIAPRPHNSGHWTIDACTCSQFEQHVRTVAGLPLGSFERHSDAIMLNLLGNDILEVSNYLRQPNACVHDYGKGEIKPGRKMGHVTILGIPAKSA